MSQRIEKYNGQKVSFEIQIEPCHVERYQCQEISKKNMTHVFTTQR
jgi:hypothetical protein